MKRNDGNFGKLNKGQRWWIMNRVLGLTVQEIAKIDDATANRVNHAIKEVSDRIITGQVILTNPTADKVDAAIARIDKKGQRDRCHTQKAA